MGLMVLLKFALVCIDYLAWPVIALGFPLFASIRTVENDSKYHMKKLIIYWTLFSLISLFEFAFMKVIVRIPFWDSIRLLAIIWLVMPGFQGACHAYQILVRPVLSVDVQAVIDKLYKKKEDKRAMNATFLEATEQYIKENGCEALERLITTKQECNNSEREILVSEPEEKNDVATSELTTPPDTSEGRTETPPIKKPQQKWSTETPPIKKPQQKWSCDICKVTTTSETTLKAHLQGSKHRTNCEALKASKFHAGVTRPSSSKGVLGPYQNQAKPKQDGETIQMCKLCSVKLTGNSQLASHVKGKQHMSNVKKILDMNKLVEMN